MSRSVAEWVIADLRSDRENLRRTLEIERQRSDRLAAELLRMKRDGWVPQPEPPPDTGLQELPAKVLGAIDQRSFNPAMERQLQQYAAQMLREGKDEDAVAQTILDGEQLDEGPESEV